MTQDQFVSLLRNVLTALGAVLVATGRTSEAIVQQFIGAAISAASLMWVIWDNRKAGLIKSAVALPEVRAIEVSTRALADAAASADPSVNIKVKP